MTVEQYIEKINTRYKTGISREHSYRGDLQNLIEAICPEVLVTNEPARVECGAPDYILTNKNIPVGYIEAKDLGANLNDKSYKEQFDRYKASLSNLIFTDYLDFHLYRDGEFQASVAIGKIENGKLIPLPDRYKEFENIIRDFATQVSQTIRSAEKLSKMMAAKARMLASVIENAVLADEEATNQAQEDANNSLREQLAAFKQILIHDITPREFADIYAQTIAYGMFAARLHDPTLENFTRIEAAELIPKSNPFLRKLFQYVAGYDLDNRIKWIVDALADIFRETDVAAILRNFGKSTQQQDPIIHFYETFLGEYDPRLRKARGVWYTPEPVVKFIVRAVDDILKTEFGLKDGLADTSKTKVKVKAVSKATADARSKIKETEIEQEVHKVQILDPATGTGTFLAEIIKHVHTKFAGQQGIWNKYVDDHLIPRLNGFEILMASYAMAHLKLDLLLTETGYKAQKEQRFKVFLTNSLEEHHPDTGTLFANWLSTEANEANRVKRDTPVMVIVGNPPYSGESQNKNAWILKLMEDYKKEPGGKEKLNEKNSKAINADEYKFIRYAQNFIEKNENGVLAFINPHTFIDSPIFRGMRWNILKTFDKIYVLDLHGNSTKKELTPYGDVDTNVFDIKQGVSINIFIKTGLKKPDQLGRVFHADLFGKREFKYEFLRANTISSIGYREVTLAPPSYFFINKDLDVADKYYKGVYILDLMSFKTSGVKTHDDASLVSFSRSELKSKVESKYSEFDESKVYEYSYRPFDIDFVYYDTSILGRAREKTIYHLKYHNVGLVLVAQPQSANLNYFDCVFVIKHLADTNIFRRGGPVAFPLYLYSSDSNQSAIESKYNSHPNINREFVKEVEAGLDLKFSNEKTNEPNTFAPIDVLDYIYAILHSPSYREKYKEFLKIDFPRVPYPTNREMFWSLVKLGGDLRNIHLLESPVVEQYITQYPVAGSNIVEKPEYKNGQVYIPSQQRLS